MGRGPSMYELGTYVYVYTYYHHYYHDWFFIERFRDPQKTMKEIVRFQEQEKKLLGLTLPQVLLYVYICALFSYTYVCTYDNIYI